MPAAGCGRAAALIALLAAGASAASPQPPAPGPPQVPSATPAPTQDPKNWEEFNALFSGVSIHIPTINITTNKTSGDYIALKQAVASNLSIYDLSVAHGGAAGDKQRSLTLTLANLTLHLDALVDIVRAPIPFLGLFPTYNFSVRHATVTLHAELGFTLDISPLTGVPSAVHMYVCELSTPVLDFNCSNGEHPKGSGLCDIVQGLLPELPELVTTIANKSGCAYIGNATKDDGPIGGAVNLLNAAVLFLGQAEKQLPAPLPQGLPGYSAAIDKAESGLRSVAAAGNLSLVSFDANSTLWRAADVVLDSVFGGPATAQTWPGRLVVDELIDEYTSLGDIQLRHIGLSLPIKLLPELALIDIGLLNLTVTGLDRISKLDVAHVAANHTMWHSVAVAEFGISLWTNLTFTSGTWVTTQKQGSKPVSFSELVELSITAKNVTLDLVTTIGVDGAKFAALPLGDLLGQHQKGSGRGPLSCLLQPFVLSQQGRSQGCCQWCGLSLPGLSVRIGDLDLWEVSVGSPGWGPGVDNVLHGAVAGLLGPYKGPLLQAVPLLVSKYVRPLLNVSLTALVGLETEAAPNCYAPPPAAAALAQPEYIDFSASPANKTLGLIDFLLGTVLGPDWGPNSTLDRNDASINAILRAFGNNPDGSWTLRRNGSGSLVDMQVPPSIGGIDIGNLHVQVANLTISGLAEFSRLSLLTPNKTDPYALDNLIRMVRGSKLNVSVDLGLDWTQLTSSDNVHNHFALWLWSDSLEADAVIHAQVEPAKAYALELGNAVSAQCLMTTLGGKQALRLPVLRAAGREFGVMVACHHCSSPMLQGDFQDHMGSPAGIQFVTKAMNGILGFVGNAVNTQAGRDALDHMVEKAQCPAPAPAPKEKDSDSDFGLAMVYILVAGMCGICFIAFVVAFAIAARRAGGARKLHWEQSLFRSEAVPASARVLVPLALLTCFALFVSSHCSVGIEADLVFHVAGDKLAVEKVFTYQLKTAVGDMWNAGVYPLSLLIGIMSGGWPYVKVMLLAFLWFMPPEVVRTSRRGTYLQVVDYLGKWSLVDMFVFVMFVVGFRMHIFSPEKILFLPEGAVVVDLYIIPHWGLHGFVLAAMLSLAVNHYQVFCDHNTETVLETAALAEHDQEVLSGRKQRPLKPHQDDEDSDCSSPRSEALTHVSKSVSWIHAYPGRTREALCMHQFGEDSEYKGLSGTHKVVLTILLLVAFSFMLWGAASKTFSFAFEGLVAAIMDYCNKGSAKNDYSIFTLTSHVIDQAHDVAKYLPEVSGGVACTYMSYWFIGVTFILFTIIVPIIMVVGLLAMWLVPLTLSEQKIVLFCNNILAAWSSTEVFIVSLLAALLEIGQFAAFLIGGRCDGINAVLGGPGVAFGVIQDLGYVEPKCFDVKTSFKPGVWILFGAIALTNALYVVLIRVVTKTISHREQQWRDGVEGRDRKLPASPEDDDEHDGPAGVAEP
eukprot:TRINITY_DN5_c0_g1_i1.p1 TRINITY_DN5_c0_g1~~TRINITY_DN5_c0_g1_i1.p1  ORF type:complete len:1504 (+),score=553.56 TRINITY_DN5_c0_g1_i1:150-4514(+)